MILVLCIPIIARDTAAALALIAQAEPLADMIEIRLDVMESCALEELIRACARPVMVTYRSTAEGGKGVDDAETCFHHVMRAVEAGADFVDVEYRLPVRYRREILSRAPASRVVLSRHFPEETPSEKDLSALLRDLSGSGCGIVKIVTRARRAEDNLRVLDLIPMARERGVKIIAFCMGPLGRVSRVASPLLGGFLTFAALEKGAESADGQLPVQEMKAILESLSP